MAHHAGRRRALLHWSSMLATLAIISACGGGPSGPSGASQLSIVAGDGQTGGVGIALPIPISIIVRGNSGPLAAIAVTFTVSAGGGSVAQATVPSSPTGSASTVWTLGGTLGAQTVTVTAGGAPPVTFTATALAGPAALVSVVQGNNQTATIGQLLPGPHQVRVTDAFGNPRSGETVTFVAVTGGGQLTGTVQISDATGIATLGGWTLGLLPGFQSVEARVAGAATATIIAIANPIPPAAFNAVSGNNLSVNAGTLVNPAPTIEARDSMDRPMPGVEVTFQVVSGGGRLLGLVKQSTDETGRVSVTGWVVGLTPGINTLTASTFGAPTVTFQATGVIAVPSAIALLGGSGMSEFQGNYLSGQPNFRVTDAAGAPIAGANVSFVASDGGTIGGAVGTTDFDGMAAPLAWRLGNTLGPQTLSATVGGLPPVIATATATTPPAQEYNIDVRFNGTPPTPGQQAAFDNAVVRWSQIILGDQPDVLLDATAPQTSCPSIIETVDDIVIFATLEEIDGVGQILGSAGPCLVRTSNQLTITGRMRFDTADLANLESNGTLGSVILHEMGHVIGIGTRWSSLNLLVGRGSDMPFFTGPSAIAAFYGALAPGATFNQEVVPVENSGGPGTRDGHWRESILDQELMTGFNDAQNFLSAITSSSLRDMGYVVDDAQSDPFSFQVALRAATGSPGMRLNEVPLPGPIYAVDRWGRVTDIIPR